MGPLRSIGRETSLPARRAEISLRRKSIGLGIDTKDASRHTFPAVPLAEDGKQTFRERVQRLRPLGHHDCRILHRVAKHLQVEQKKKQALATPILWDPSSYRFGEWASKSRPPPVTDTAAIVVDALLVTIQWKDTALQLYALIVHWKKSIWDFKLLHCSYGVLGLLARKPMSHGIGLCGHSCEDRRWGGNMDPYSVYLFSNNWTPTAALEIRR
ncbi:hypothetical protein CEXT_697331 [Caerostris extrusa]|uniref:Uncharacterized protein n=1 Tax=Caerostris extrusa TaxID=172846 RepID=A0AAV4YFM8_CAEEX|nr:hypothetical protein CEXT_697331 [Caerostris extrusa]